MMAQLATTLFLQAGRTTTAAQNMSPDYRVDVFEILLIPQVVCR